jgi:RHS repeat-associated protein
VYDARFGKPLSHTDANQLATNWSYDPLGRMVQELRPDGTKTAIAMAFANTTWVGVPPLTAGYIVTKTVDGAPWTKSYTDVYQRDYKTETQGYTAGSTIVTATTFDNHGWVATKSRPGYGAAGPVHTFTYDALGRPIKEVSPLTTPNAAFTYVYGGLTTTVTNAKAQVTKKTLNVRGDLASVTDSASNPPTRYRYDAFGNLRTVTDAVGNVIDVRYDRLGRKTLMIDPDTGTHTYVYNQLGEVLQETDAQAQIRTFGYDLLGRMVTRAEPEGTSSWQYDTALHGIGKLARATGASGDVRSLSYDLWSRPASNALAYGGLTVGLQYGYDTLGRPATTTFPTGFVSEQRYSATGYLSEVWGTDSLGTTRYWKANSVNADGQLTEAALGNGLVTRNGYDVMGKPTSVVTGITPVTTLVGTVQDLAFHYDLLGNLDSRDDKRAVLNETFAYDSLNRLSSSLATNQALKTYQYDALGNITFKSGVGSYTYSRIGAGPHAVTGTSTGNKTYAYDANGNLISGDGRSIAYTSFNLPRQISAQGGTVLNTIVYDSGRSRIRMTGPDGVQTYLDDGKIEYERLDAAGAITHTHYLYAAGKMVATYATSNVGTAEANYLHHDHLGSIDTVTDNLGNVIERLSYDVHGKRRDGNTWADSPGFLNPATTHRGFTEHEHLDAVGLIHMNGRVYDPTLGRFLSADPNVQASDNPQTFNRYSYVLNNPLSLTDPTGFFFEEIGSWFYSLGDYFSGVWDSWSMAFDSFVSSVDQAYVEALGSASEAYAAVNASQRAADKGAQSTISNSARQEQPTPSKGIRTDVTSVTDVSGLFVKGSTFTGERYQVALAPLAASAAAGGLGITEGAFLGLGGFQPYGGPVGTPPSSGYDGDSYWGYEGGRLTSDRGDYIYPGRTERVDRFGSTVFPAKESSTNETIYNQEEHPTFKPGPFADESIPARSSARDFNAQERSEGNRIFSETGCHTCGTFDSGTKSGNAVLDHQPVSALNFNNEPQRLYPQCLGCSRDQGLAVIRFLRSSK